MCSLNRSKCVGNNHLTVYPSCCCYINVTPMRCGSLTTWHSLFLPNDQFYVRHRRGRTCFIERIRCGLHFHSGHLVSEARRPAEQESGSWINRRHKTEVWSTSSIFTPIFHGDDISGELRWNGNGMELSDAFKLTKLVWTVTLIIIIIGH